MTRKLQRRAASMPLSAAAVVVVTASSSSSSEWRGIAARPGGGGGGGVRSRAAVCAAPRRPCVAFADHSAGARAAAVTPTSFSLPSLGPLRRLVVAAKGKKSSSSSSKGDGGGKSPATSPAASPGSRVEVEFDMMPLNEKFLLVAIESATQGFTSGVLGGFAGLVYGGVTQRSLLAARTEGAKFFKTWGMFGAVYNLGMGVSRTVRGKQDKYNSVIAACASGAVFGREQGARGMLGGCAQFAGFTYLLETFLVSPQQQREQQRRTLEIPVDGGGGGGGKK